ncbi:MAG: phosphoglycolate phosphatase [Sulfuricellaceae bacterium]
MSSTEFPLPIRAVAIDLDGTLLDTAPDIADAAQRMLRDLGMASVDQAKIQSFIGNGIANLVKRALTGEMHGKPDAALFERALPLFRQHYAAVLTRTTHPYPGALEGVQALRAAGFALACVTNKAQAFSLPLLEAMKLKDEFQLILSGDSLPQKKPDPLPLLHTAEYFGCRPAELLLIGDSLNDTLAANAAGCPVFLVPYGYNGGQDVREQRCDAVIANLPETLKLITKV